MHGASCVLRTSRRGPFHRLQTCCRRAPWPDILWPLSRTHTRPHIRDCSTAGKGGLGGPAKLRFALDPHFVASYAETKPPFGFNGLGELVFATRYARQLQDDRKEVWHETVRRVVEGCYSMQLRWITSNRLGWEPARAQRSAQEMYRRIFKMQFLPPGRGLWAMGSPLTEERDMFAALNNCAFVSTRNLADDAIRPFCFLMDAAMLGVGVGFNVAGAGTITVAGPARGSHVSPTHTVSDSREGWVESLKLLLEAHFYGRPRPTFDYSKVRPRGAPIKGFGGTASGPGVLARLHDDIDSILAPLAGGKPITITAIVDLFNAIGRCIVSGDVRQTAEIAFGPSNSEEYIDLKVSCAVRHYVSAIQYFVTH